MNVPVIGFAAIAVLGCAVVMTAPTHGARAIAVEHASDERIQLLARGKPEERINAYTSIARDNEALVEGLISIVRTQKETYERHDARQLAVQLLASMGTAQAIPVFVEHIEYHQAMVVTEASPLNGYPCALALRKIGQSSIPAIISFLQTRSPDQVSEKSLDLMTWVCFIVYGPNEGGPDEAVGVVHRAHRRAVEKRNLARLFEKMKTIQSQMASDTVPRDRAEQRSDS